VNTLGSIAVASTTAASKISAFVVCPFDALGSTMATFGGQNVGAGKLDRLPKGVWTAGLIGSIYSIVILGVLWLWGDYLLLLFVSADETLVLAQAHQFQIISACFYIPLAYVNIVRFMIQGMGFSGFAVFAGVFEMIARTLVGLFLVPRFGFTAACFASPLAWIFADAFLIPAFYLCLHKLQKKIGTKSAD
jgi:Na+-driven multidrug efflux pump